jgi:hypothetical protein
MTQEKTIAQSRDRQGADPLADARGSVRISIFEAVFHAPAARPKSHENWRKRQSMLSGSESGSVSNRLFKTSTPIPIATPTPMVSGLGYFRNRLARISHQLSTAAADPGISPALRSVGLLDILSSMSAGPSVARLVSIPVCAASLRKLVRNAG